MAPGLTFTKAYTSTVQRYDEAVKNHPTTKKILMIPGAILSVAAKLTALALDVIKDTILTGLCLAATILTLGLSDRAVKSLVYHGEGLAQDLTVLGSTLVLNPIIYLHVAIVKIKSLGSAGK
jgi:hypothetical protein